MNSMTPLNPNALAAYEDHWTFAAERRRADIEEFRNSDLDLTCASIFYQAALHQLRRIAEYKGYAAYGNLFQRSLAVGILKEFQITRSPRGCPL